MAACKLRLPSQRLVAAVFKPCREQLSPALAKLLSQDVVESFGQWCYRPSGSNPLPAPQPLAVVHALAGDKGPDVRLCPNDEDPSAKQVFEEEHAALLESQSTIVVRFSNTDMELVLVPVKVKTGKGNTGAAFWGYTVPAHLLNMASSALHYGRLLVVFDLDETLLMAHTVDSLAQRIRRVNAAKEAKAAELQNINTSSSSSEQAAGLLQAELALLEAEGQLLQSDFEMLDFYKRDPSCRVLIRAPGTNPKMAEPSWEKVLNSQGQEIVRPVVRIELGGRPLTFTRIDPTKKSTSVLVRPRPNWRQLKDYLSGLEDVRMGQPRRQRWEVFICTTADREYALEAWRLLDHDASIFGREELLMKRMLCVPHPQKKDILNVLRQELMHYERQMNPAGPPTVKMVTDEARAQKADLTTANLTVVVDDRADVWEDASRRALLQVMPFHPHKEAAALDLGPAAAPPTDYHAARESEGELVRVIQTLKELRSKFYHQLDTDIKPEAHRLVSSGLSDSLQALPLEILAPMKPVPELLDESTYRPPAALGLTEQEDRASDLRLLANDSTMMAAAAAAAAGGSSSSAAGVDGAPVGDPRKRRAAAAAAAAAAAPVAKEVAAAAQEAGEQQRASGEGTAADKQKEAAAKPSFANPLSADSIAGLLQSLKGATAQQDEQQQQEEAMPDAAQLANGAVGAVRARASASDSDEEQQRAAKKQRMELQPLTAGSSLDKDASGANRAATPGLNNSIGAHGGSSTSGAGLLGPRGADAGGANISTNFINQQQQSQQQQMLPPHPLTQHNVTGLLHVPPAHVLAVLQAAAAACPSPNDMAAYQDLFPSALRGLATPGQLLEALAVLASKLSMQDGINESIVSVIKQAIAPEVFNVLTRVAKLVQSNAEVAGFLHPVMLRAQAPGAGAGAGAGADAVTAGAGAALAPQQQQQGTGGSLQHVSGPVPGAVPSTGAGSVAGGSMGLGNQQQQQQQQSVQTATVDFRNLGVGGPPPPPLSSVGAVLGPPSSTGGLRGPDSQAAAAAGAGAAGQPPPGGVMPHTFPPVMTGPHSQQQQQQQPPGALVADSPADQMTSSQRHNMEQGFPPVPTPEWLVRLNSAPDSFNYSYEAMKEASACIDANVLYERHGIKNAPSALGMLSKNFRGPRVDYHMFQGDKRPGQVQDLSDPNFTCVLSYWGKDWGYGYASNKKAAKAQAAGEALLNMYVSGIWFDRLPNYKGRRPAAPPAATGPPMQDPAAPGTITMQQLQQQQQPQGGNAGSPMQLPGQQQQQFPQPPASQQQQLQQDQQVAAGSSASQLNGLTAHEQLKRRFGLRVKFTLLHTRRNNHKMKATLYERMEPNSRIIAEAFASGVQPDVAVENVALALLKKLDGRAGQGDTASTLAPQQQQRRQQPSSGWDAAGGGNNSVAPPGSAAPPPPMQQQQHMGGMQLPMQQQQPQQMMMMMVAPGQPVNQQQFQQQRGTAFGPPPPVPPPRPMPPAFQQQQQQQGPGSGPNSGSNLTALMLAGVQQAGAQAVGAQQQQQGTAFRGLVHQQQQQQPDFGGPGFGGPPSTGSHPGNNAAGQMHMAPGGPMNFQQQQQQQQFGGRQPQQAMQQQHQQHMMIMMGQGPAMPSFNQVNQHAMQQQQQQMPLWRMQAGQQQQQQQGAGMHGRLQAR